MEQNLEKAADRTEQYRGERKFVIDALDIKQIESIVWSHPAMFSKAYLPRFVNNIYFDSPDFHSYADNIKGSAERYKFRIRWYGEQFGLIHQPILEIKIKKGLAGSKKNYPLVPFNLENGFSQTTINNVFDRSDIPTDLRLLLKSLSPSLLNRYYRKYFLSADRKFRITLDCDLRFTRISGYQNYFMQYVVNDNKIILELKYDIENDISAGRISEKFPFRLNKNSKYVNGVQNLDIW